jgi:hypothetical protein
MKVLDLRCGSDHRFEGWFASEEDFQSQEERGLVSCPICADAHVFRLPSAPRLNVSHLREAAPPAPVDPKVVRQVHFMRAVRQLMERTEDVGERFPEEVRRIHYGEVEERGIRGQATPEAADALREEGIEVFSLPVPLAVKGPVQ